MPYVKPGHPKKYTDADIDQVLAWRAEGVTWAECAERLGKSTTNQLRSAVQRRREGRVTPDSSPAPAAPPPLAPRAPDPEPADEDEDLLVSLRRMMQSSLASAKTDPDARGALQATRNATELAKVIARVEKQRHVEADVVTIPRAEVETMRARIADRARVVLSRPIRCADCGRRVAAELVEAHREKS